MLLKQLQVGRRVETDDQRATLPERRSPQVARGPQQESEKFTFLRFRLPQVDANHSLPLDGVDFVHSMDQFERLFLFQSRLPRIHLDGSLDMMFRKKLLRLGAGLSSGAMVPPVNLGHRHLLSSCPAYVQDRPLA